MMTELLPARTLDLGASATASLPVKIAITYVMMSERRGQMVTYSLFEKRMRNEMPSDQQGYLGAILLIEDRGQEEGKPHQQPRREQLYLRETGDGREAEWQNH